MARPKFVPNEEQRRLVKSMAAYGIVQEGIAIVVGLRSVKTLRKHFLPELLLGAIEAAAQVSQSHFTMAKSANNLKATLTWSNKYGRRWMVDSTVEARPRAI